MSSSNTPRPTFFSYGRQWRVALCLAVALTSRSDRAMCNAFIAPNSEAKHILAPLLAPSLARSKLNLYIDHNESGTSGPSSTTPKVSGRRRHAPPQKEYLHEATSPAELDRAIQSETEKLVVVRFHAPYCKACQTVRVAFERIASSNPHIKFVDVLIKDRLDYPNHDVPATPYAHIYHPKLGLVEHSPISRRQLSPFKNALKWWQDLEAALPEEFHSDPDFTWDRAKLSWSNPLGLDKTYN